MQNTYFIEQDFIANSEFANLQKKTIEELQRLSGKIWTNYNIHDPGITIGSIANYALEELDYKLGVDLIDYLTQEHGRFMPETYGMFLPEKVYPSTPVTLEDYQKLFLIRFPALENVKMIASDNGNYDIQIVMSSFGGEVSDIERNIKECFHENRNLCENLNSIKKIAPTTLWLHSEIEIETGYDPADVLAEVYCKILLYLYGNKYSDYFDRFYLDEHSWEEWFEGVIGKSRVLFPKQENTMAELRQILLRNGGIKELKTCYLTKGCMGLNELVADFSEGYSLYIPQRTEELIIKIRRGGSEITIDNNFFSKFRDKLRNIYLLNRSYHFEYKDEEMNESFKIIPKGTYRKLFHYDSMMNDFPSCYKAFMKSSSASDSIKLKQFGAYIKLFDLIICRGVTELKGLKDLISIDKDNCVLSRMEILSSSEISSDNPERYKDVYCIKSMYLDFLDHLYGVESNPTWLHRSGVNESRDEIIIQRMNFQRNIPFLTRTRSKSYNIYLKNKPLNIPTIKAHLCLLLGMKMDEDSGVSNVLSDHHLTLLSSADYDKYSSIILDISEKELSNAALENLIELDTPPQNEEEREQQYSELRDSLPLLSNSIPDYLYRKGIYLDNYRSIKLGNSEFILVFVNHADSTVLELGRFERKKEVSKVANILCRYLYDLNSLCETLYVIEHIFLIPDHPFIVSFVFPDWTERFRSIEFRNRCKELIISLLPAHIAPLLHWLDSTTMGEFEAAYKELHTALADGVQGANLKSIQDRILTILKIQRT